jgi:hypothetical protein
VTPVQLEVKRRLTGYDYYTLISVAPPKRFRIRGLEDKLKIVQHSPRTVTQNTIEQDLLKLKKEGFIPDIVIVDYLDDMKRDAGSDALFREAFRQCSEALKAVAVKYNCAVISATQSNQAGKGKDKLDSTNNSEAFAKMHGVDTFETITRSPINKKRGYAILYVENNRGGKDEITAGVSQCLAFGQFCIDSEEITDEVEAEQGRQAREAVNDLREVIIADLRLHPTDTTAMVAARHVNSRTSRHVSAEYVRGFLADRTLFTEEEARGHQGVPGRPTR